MKFSQWYRKTFEKGKVVHAIIRGDDLRLRNYYVIPKVIAKTPTQNDPGFQNLEIECGNGIYFINKRDFHLDADGIPTFIYLQNNRIPVDMDNLKQYSDKETPASYRQGIEAHVARDILKTVDKKMDSATLSLILSFIVLIGVGLIGYLVYEQQAQLLEMMKILKFVGGLE